MLSSRRTECTRRDRPASSDPPWSGDIPCPVEKSVQCPTRQKGNNGINLTSGAGVSLCRYGLIDLYCL